VEVQSEDGRYFARTENVTALDGSAPKFFAFIAFDNMTKAKTFNDSMKNTTALRTRVTNVTRCPLMTDTVEKVAGIPLDRKK
jgi:uncharacterized protein (DUF1330 family)